MVEQDGGVDAEGVREPEGAQVGVEGVAQEDRGLGLRLRFGFG